MAGTRRTSFTSRLVVAAATFALLAGCTTSGGDDAGTDDPTTTTVVKKPVAWTRQVLDGPKIVRNQSRVTDGELLAAGSGQRWLLGGIVDTLKAAKPVIWTSPDRTAWERQDLPGGATDTANLELAVGDGKALAVGRNEAADGPSTPVWQLNGERWTKVGADLPDDAQVTVAVRAAKAWFVLGAVKGKDGASRDAVWRSTDGARWKQVFVVPEGGDLRTLAGLANVAVAGTLGSGEKRVPVVWYSKAGTSWSKGVALPTVVNTHPDPGQPGFGPGPDRPTTNPTVSSLAQGAEGWKAIGTATDQDRTRPVTWSSADGITWTPGDAIFPAAEAGLRLPDRSGQRVVWTGAGFLAYGGTERFHEIWENLETSDVWTGIAAPSSFVETEADGAYTALVGDAEGNLLAATTTGGRLSVWKNDATQLSVAAGSFDSEVTDPQLMPDDADYTDIYDLTVHGRTTVVVGRLDDGGEHPLLWTGPTDGLTLATGSEGLSGRVDIASVTDDKVLIWGSDQDDYSLKAWTSPIAKPALNISLDVTDAIGATSTQAGVTSIHASFDIGDRTFLAGVDPEGPVARPAVWALDGNTFTKATVQAEGSESIQSFTGGCGAADRGLAYGKAYGNTPADDDPPIVDVLAADGSGTAVDRAQIQPRGTVASIVTCVVDGDTFVLGGSLSRDGKPESPALWTSKDGKRWTIDDDLGTGAAGRVYRLVGYRKGLAAIVEDRDGTSVWRTDQRRKAWKRISEAGTFDGSSVYVNGFAVTADGQLVIGGASRNQATIWTLPADGGR